MSTPSTIVKALITLIPAVTLAVTPASADVMVGSQLNYAAAVGGAPNTLVTWSAALGTISSTGVYTPPSVSADTADTVTATSQAAPTSHVSVPLRVHPSAGIWFMTQANGLQAVVFNGTNYNYLYGENLLTSVTTATANGNVTGAPACTGSFTATTVTKHCATTGGDSVDISATFSAPAAAAGTTTAAHTNVGTIQANIQLTNNSAKDTIASAMWSILGVSMAQYNAASSVVKAVDATNPISYVNYGTGQFAIWNNTPSESLSMNMTCGWTYVCKNQPIMTNIAPGQTVAASFSLRFTNDTTAPTVNLAPEAFNAFRSAFPSVVNWPDRRPIMAWFISDHSHQSATNPRGYLNDPTMDVTNIPNFTSKVMAQAQNILSQMQARSVKPQGILLWDIEGQEFIQPTTYIGDPRVLGQGYSPEMNATADQLFALFKNAGFKVGLTLRPQYMQWGTTKPSNCHYDPSNAYKDYFINVSAPYNQKFYACYDPAGVNWSLIPQSNGGQTFYTNTQVAQVTALMMSKVAYAHSRWGAQLFYVDTSVWVGGTPIPQDVFRALQLAYPDCIFIPEENYAATMGVAMPYSDPNNGSAPKFSPVSWRYIYPTGALGIYLGNCSGACWTNNINSFLAGQMVGDIPIYQEPTQSYLPQLAAIEAMIQQARTQAGQITVTDSSSGALFSYNGTPSTVYQYPLKMRVYFAPSAAQMAASTTYCEAGGWTGTNTCALNLSGLLTAQIRYYDFNNQLIVSGTAGPR